MKGIVKIYHFEDLYPPYKHKVMWNAAQNWILMPFLAPEDIRSEIESIAESDDSDFAKANKIYKNHEEELRTWIGDSYFLKDGTFVIIEKLLEE